jgi:hypothetical protein
MTGMMHRAGVNHRDCYICHFLLHTDKPVTADDFKLSVIDLHRAQTRAKITRRWRDKDLAALYFSALDIGLTRRDKLRFLKGYFQQPLRQILAEEAALAGSKARPTSSMRANNVTGMRSDGGLDTGAAYSDLADDFGSLEAVFALQGERLTRDPLSEVIRVQRDGVNYYVKRYVGAGKACAATWASRGSRPNGRTSSASPSGAFPPPKWWPGAWSATAWPYSRGAMITRELPRTEDLSALAERNDPRWPTAWVDGQPPTGRLHPDHARPPLYP